MERKTNVRIRGKTNLVTGESQPSSSGMKKPARAQTVATKRKAANTSEKLESLRTQMLNILVDNPQKFQDQRDHNFQTQDHIDPHSRSYILHHFD